eukprot:SM000011S19084  [mRNA]  locus=s11:835068:836825:+ [translate_table: standard]
MRAWQYTRYKGGAAALRRPSATGRPRQRPDAAPPPQLEEGVAVPAAGKGQLLLAVVAASVNPLDWKVQSGMFWPLLPAKLPHVPGGDIAGKVVAVGPGVPEFAVGDHVVAWLSPLVSQPAPALLVASTPLPKMSGGLHAAPVVQVLNGRGACGPVVAQYGGSLAEYAAVDAKVAVKLPEAVPATDACCFPVAALTAVQSLQDKGGIADFGGGYKGNVLVEAASGGVGHYAVQVRPLPQIGYPSAPGKAGGRPRDVHSGCSELRLLTYVKGLGADEVIDYKSEEGRALKSPSGKLYDIVVDSTGHGEPWSKVRRVLAPGGRHVVLVPSGWVFLNLVGQTLAFAGKRQLPCIVSVNKKDLGLVVELAAAGKLRTTIDASLPFDKAPEAWAKSIDGHVTGKVIVTM